MKRLLWLGAGLAIGALVVRQVSRAARAYSPAGLAGSARNSAADLWDSVQDFSGRAQQWVGDFVADVREGMAEREQQIQAAFVRGESLAELDAMNDDHIDYVDEDDERTR
jgi:hypothetical protein